MDLGISIIHCIPAFFLLLAIFMLYINLTRNKMSPIMLYLFWALILGIRSVFKAYGHYGIMYFDPLTYLIEARDYTIEELAIFTFPSFDVLLQLIMKLFYQFTSNDNIVLFLTELIPLILIYISLSKNLFYNSNIGLVLFLLFLIFTNCGILLISNFIRQGLAISVFVYLTTFFQSEKMFFGFRQILLIFLFLVVLFFIHNSSILLVFFFIYAKYQDLKKNILIKILPIIFFFVGLFFLDFFKDSDIKYSAYQGYYEEGVYILYNKLFIDFCLVFFISYIMKYENPILSNNHFNRVLKVTIIYLYLFILLFINIPIISLRIEYYLNFLLFYAIVKLLTEVLLSNERKGKSFMMFYTIILYIYSFFVYEHPSIKRVLIFSFNLQDAN